MEKEERRIGFIQISARSAANKADLRDRHSFLDKSAGIVVPDKEAAVGWKGAPISLRDQITPMIGLSLANMGLITSFSMKEQPLLVRTGNFSA